MPPSPSFPALALAGVQAGPGRAGSGNGVLPLLASLPLPMLLSSHALLSWPVQGGCDQRSVCIQLEVIVRLASPLPRRPPCRHQLDRTVNG